ncbi:WSC domain-containing protein 2 [Diplogelasinospora grovesii]|uniref:WSC domain-containing protein 2 n=1 Tax=Diplogelasinospora grovesii TaxID=303347 RepID=A0AAN6N9Z2_9PEZI|nr:WSC domain-containing protein 2 [Diplogelasinospora grovesii]
MSRFFSTTGLLALFLQFLLLSAVARAQGINPQIYNSTANGYKYYGCYNETTDIAGTSGARALDGGVNEVKPGAMTVEMCQSFCKTGGGNGKFYKYAGLEYARECWCADEILGYSAKFDDALCNLPCEGNSSEVCGGNLKLTVYIAGASRVVGYGVAALAVAVSVGLNLL